MTSMEHKILIEQTKDRIKFEAISLFVDKVPEEEVKDHALDVLAHKLAVIEVKEKHKEVEW